MEFPLQLCFSRECQNGPSEVYQNSSSATTLIDISSESSLVNVSQPASNDSVLPESGSQCGSGEAYAVPESDIQHGSGASTAKEFTPPLLVEEPLQ